MRFSFPFNSAARRARRHKRRKGPRVISVEAVLTAPSTQSIQPVMSSAKTACSSWYSLKSHLPAITERDEIFQGIEEWCGDAAQPDDITMMVLKVNDAA